jgi:predicted amidohydrolase YtcJ
MEDSFRADTEMNPYLNIMFATHDPFRPEESITREQAVIAYTLTSACAEFAEKEKGSLESGKLADLAVLSRDLFERSEPQAPLYGSRSIFVGTPPLVH